MTPHHFASPPSSACLCQRRDLPFESTSVRTRDAAVLRPYAALSQTSRLGTQRASEDIV
jgi:hypothetical protein